MTTPFLSAPLSGSLSGQTTVVLGGAGNVGESIVRAHLAAGATVVVPSRDAARVEVVRRGLTEGADRLVAIEGDTETFDGMRRVAEHAVARAGVPAHVVASPGGWYQGPPVWQLDERAWETHCVAPSRAHVAAARALLPVMPDGGSYTMILGLAAYVASPGSTPVAMRGGALRMLRQVLSAEVRQGRRVSSLAFAPLINRARPRGDPSWLSSEHVGRLTVALAGLPGVTGRDFQIATLTDYDALMASGFTAETTRV